MTDYEAFMHDRITPHVVEDGDCLRWQRCCINGHPSFSHGDKRGALVRRVLWQMATGPIPAGKVLRCTCGTPGCIALDHLEVTTYRAIAKTEGKAGKMSGPVRSARIAAVKRAGKQARITQSDAVAIRNSDEHLKPLALRYGISQSTVSKIKRGTVRRDFSSPWQGLAA